MTERSLDEQLVRLDRLIKAGQVAAGAAHEINNLLGPLLWHLERLDRLLTGDCVADAPRSISVALDAALHIRTIVQDTLSLARQDFDGTGCLDLNHVVADACRLAEPVLKPRARVVVESQRVPCLRANVSQLIQLVLNLLLNAANAFAEPDPEHNQVRVRVWSESDWVCLEVSDNGRGMTSAVQRQVFDAFYSTREPTEGAGLGLWVCRTVTENHAGRIDLESTMGEGTRVVLRLPVRGKDIGEGT